MYRLAPFADIGLTEDLLDVLINEHQSGVVPKLAKWWAYFRNQDSPKGLAQAAGLPARLIGSVADADDRIKREVVIENDIAWRIQTMVDFMFGKPVRIISTAPSAVRANAISEVLDAVWEASGGISLFQDMALLGHIHGHVDLLLRAHAHTDDPTQAVRIEVIEPIRGIPILDPDDYRVLRGYVIHFERSVNAVSKGIRGPRRRAHSHVTEIVSASHRQRYIDGALVESEALPLSLGRVPVAHMQNLGQPFRYAGLGEVEPLVPLQDELNTRLSDRASRVTLQSFQMYLAKGIDGFTSAPVGPGQVWATDNLDANVIPFGGDSSSPSEQAHIEQIREAIDKVSGVPPLASGVVRARIGNLSSATALRVTLMGLLAKTMRKRVTYGRGVSEISRMALDALDAAGIFKTDPEERGIRLEWPDPLPVDIRDQILEAQAKSELGVERERVLAQLGEGTADAGVT